MYVCGCGLYINIILKAVPMNTYGLTQVSFVSCN